MSARHGGLLLLLGLIPSHAYYRSVPLSGARSAMSSTSALVMGGSASPSPHEQALGLHQSLVRCAEEEDSSLGKAVKDALQVLSDALRLYGSGCLVTSFNGGKDAVVILHLMRAALAAHHEKTGGQGQVSVIFFEVPDEFPEVDAFVRQSVSDLDLHLISYSGVGFAEGLTKCIAEYGSKAFVLGTRAGDPNAKGQTAFTPSSDWMPPFMRVNPVLDWSYAEIWAFLRRFEIPCCSLYEDGYTSLGKVTTPTYRSTPTPARDSRAQALLVHADRKPRLRLPKAQSA